MKSRIINTPFLPLALLILPLPPLSASLFADDSFRQQPVNVGKVLYQNQGRDAGSSHKPVLLTSVQLPNNIVNIYQDRDSLIYYFLQTTDPATVSTDDPYGNRIMAMEASYGKTLQFRYKPLLALLEVNLGGKRFLKLPLIYTPAAAVATTPGPDGFHPQWAIPLQESHMEQLLQGMTCLMEEKNQVAKLEACATGSLTSNTDYSYRFFSYSRYFPAYEEPLRSTGAYSLSYRYLLITSGDKPRINMVILSEVEEEPEDADNGKSTDNGYISSFNSDDSPPRKYVKNALIPLRKRTGGSPGGDGPRKNQQPLTRSHYVEASEMEYVLEGLLIFLSKEKAGYNKLTAQIRKVLGSIDTLKRKSQSYQDSHQAGLQSEYQQVLDAAAASDPQALASANPPETPPYPIDITKMDEGEISHRIDKLANSDSDDTDTDTDTED